MSLSSVTTFRNLKCEFSMKERDEMIASLTRAIQKKDEYEEEKKRADADFKGLIETQSALIKRESRRISIGYEYRNVECRVDYDSPALGKKSIVRLDTGELVEELAMDADEAQGTLALAADGEDDDTPTEYGAQA